MRYRILISDDEVDIVEMLTGFFRSKGYEVFSAYNGVETLKLAELQPDIILLDINMPKLDGIEVCKKIRDCGRNKQERGHHCDYKACPRVGFMERLCLL